MPPSLRLAMEQGDPDRIDRALQAWLTPSLARHVDKLERGVAANWLTGEVEYPPERKAQLLALLEEVNRPADPGLVALEAARCLSVTASRAREAVDLQMMAAVLVDELVEFSPDVIQTAFRRWARREKWWPTLAEIREECHQLTRFRRAIVRALQ